MPGAQGQRARAASDRRGTGGQSPILLTLASGRALASPKGPSRLAVVCDDRGSPHKYSSDRHLGAVPGLPPVCTDSNRMSVPGVRDACGCGGCGRQGAQHSSAACQPPWSPRSVARRSLDFPVGPGHSARLSRHLLLLLCSPLASRLSCLLRDGRGRQILALRQALRRAVGPTGVASRGLPPREDVSVAPTANLGRRSGRAGRPEVRA